MGETLGRRENIASPGTRGKSVGVVLAEAEYITTNQQANHLKKKDLLTLCSDENSNYFMVAIDNLVRYCRTYNLYHQYF